MMMIIFMIIDDDEEEKRPKEDVITVQQYHETEECVKRLVACPRNCLEWVVFEKLEHHLEELCTKRPAEPIFCRQGCGASFGGDVDKLIEAEDDRLQHETEECMYRLVRCNYRFEDGRMCAAQMKACDRDEHRDYHLMLAGITTFKVPGTYVYRVPKGVFKLKVQLWGGGGGSGYFLDRQGGSGGGGAFVEVIIAVEPHDTLEVVVGSGGGGGYSGTEAEAAPLDVMRREMQAKMYREKLLPPGEKDMTPLNIDIVPNTTGQSLGGVPGGGIGYGGGKCWACGGGGGYSILAKRKPSGNEALCVAAGGGGGGSVDGLPGEF